jgi:Cys-tRNA(Pro) deacylase
VVAAARSRGVEITVRSYPAGTKTAQDAADVIGCEVAAIVKSLVFVVDGRPVVALVPGDLRADLGKLAAASGGEEARRATLDEVRETTGYAAGGTPPFGHDRELDVLADVRLRRHPEVWAAAGTPTTVFAVGLEDLIAASGAGWADITVD